MRGGTMWWLGRLVGPFQAKAVIAVEFGLSCKYSEKLLLYPDAHELV